MFFRRRNNRKLETALGSVLIDMGAKPFEVSEALVEQQKTGKALGEIMVRKEMITQDLLQEAVLKQKLIRGTCQSDEVTRYKKMARARTHSKTKAALREVAETAETLTPPLVEVKS